MTLILEKTSMVAEPNPPSDDQLALRVREGERAAFAQLVESHAERFYRLAYRILRNREEAQDMVQAAFLKFWQFPDKWDPEKGTRFTTWFYRVVTHLCLDRMKKKKWETTPKKFPDPTEEGGGEKAMEIRERKNRVELALGELPERQRLALNLCFYEGLSNQEASEIMGVKLKALQSLLMRAKQGLKERLSSPGGNS